MPLDYRGAKVPTSYATCSIGHKPTHTLPEKLKAISAAGFDGIELSMPDILSYGHQLHGREPDPTDYDTLVEIGKAIKSLAQEHNLQILMLQPFANFEGWAQGSKEREDAFRRARGWMRIMQAVGTDMLQVGSSDAEGIDTDFDALAADLAELADLCAQRGLRVAYENWCWATAAPGWRDVWEIVRRADRANLGLCLDTFQSAGGEWGDPRTGTGLVGGCGADDDDGDGNGKAELERKWRESLKELAATVPAEKIFLLQISDAYRMDPPLEDKPDESGLRPRGRWSHDYRPLPYDGGYLPVKDFLDAVLGTGFRGWLSVEVFDGRGKEKYDDMGEYSKKAMASLQKLLYG
ncbi:3-dehydroshikimate dehydratase [Xylaria sp. FL0933]|nr:3-dehydroshikimate dehydratase [Xylaria sp. FL0933]